jgi:hypothetical protein
MYAGRSVWAQGGIMQAVGPVLVYLYGPPAAGKLTIAEHVRDLTGFRLFHNHLTVNAIREVFDFGTPPFTELVHRIRLDVFATAMRAHTSLIFTNNSAWSGEDGSTRFRTFATQAAAVIDEAGGKTLFVQLTAPADVLESRLANPSRQAHGKLVRIPRLRELMAGFDDAPLAAPWQLSIDTSKVAPLEAAQQVAATLGTS